MTVVPKIRRALYKDMFLIAKQHANLSEQARNSEGELHHSLVAIIMACCSLEAFINTYAMQKHWNEWNTDRRAAAGPSITSGLTSVPGTSYYYSSPIPKNGDYVDSNLGDEFSYQLYVTPEDQTIKALATRISGHHDAYQMAVQWIYVSEEKLNHAADKWLTPHEFLSNTPHYPSNPLKGEEVSDCEEQANTLVSLIRAEGIRPEEVRVALGRVTFNNLETGHAWVELLMKGQWLALDPSWGPYWDDKSGKLMQRQGIPFDYYASHTYPILQVWAYYNDIYYSDPRVGTGNAPASWCKATLAQ